MEDTSGSLTPLRGVGASVPATAATSLLTIVPMDEDGNVRNISRPQTAGGAGTGVETGEAEGAQSGRFEAGAKNAEDSEGGKEALSAQSTEPLEQIALTFLLVTGRRKTMMFDLDATIGRAKELVWNAWPSEWAEDRPPAPNYLRVLYNGRILQDDDNLSKLSTPSSSSAPGTILTPSVIVHLSIRPTVPPSEDDTMLKKKSIRVGRRGTARSTNAAPGDGNADDASAGTCCGCVIC